MLSISGYRALPPLGRFVRLKRPPQNSTHSPVFLRNCLEPRALTQSGGCQAMSVDPHCVDGIWQRVVDAYAKAQESGAAFKTPTRLEILKHEGLGIGFLLRISESLKEKTKKAPKISKEDGGKRPNPFLPYEEDLWVQHLSKTHTLLLNKFNLVDHHLLVVTREFEHQEDPLNEHDFHATWTALKSMPDGGLAFFNCGSLSGASQPHKHVQVVPYPLSEGLPLDAPISTIIRQDLEALDIAAPTHLDALPFLAFGAKLNASVSAFELHKAYEGLMELNGDQEKSSGSYNLLFSMDWMMLIPRKEEAFGPCGVNALGFAGTVFVRSQEEIDFVKKVGPMAILKGVGFPCGQ